MAKSTLTPKSLMTYADTFKMLSKRLEEIANAAKKQRTRVDKVRVEDPDSPEGFGETLEEIKGTFDSVSEDFSEDIYWTVNCQC